MPNYVAGIDIGGTFTDVVVIDDAGRVTTAKASSTPPDFSTGVIDALGAAAAQLGLSLPQLCAGLQRIAHGTTVGTNTLIQKRGAKVGLITTRGHEDCLHIMRGSRGYTGRDIRKVAHFSEGPKPQPLVPKRQIIGVSERVDSAGQVIAPLNEAEAVAAILALLAQGVEALAVCFLWSFKHPAHERRVAKLAREMARDVAPGLFVTTSVDLVPKWGEYERTAAVALNAYIGPVTSRYLANIERRLAELGFAGSLQITQCGGGTVSVARAIEAPLLTLDSGPVAGVTGSAFLGQAMGHPHLITTDMGGTSFDVGIVQGGRAAASYKSNVGQYEYLLPKIDIQAIGAGGGSLARVDQTTGTLHVGPDSAGARPGPVCYGRGGTVPTVTDAALVLGYLDGTAFAGGSLPLDVAAARTALAKLGARIGLSADECAAGVCRIVEFRMADLIRRATVEKGHDPRDFVLLAFGGAGPVHAGVFAREVGVRQVLVPQRRSASVWCAFGAATADLLHVIERALLLPEPFDLAALNDALDTLAQHGAEQLAREGAAASELALSIDLRHRGQINELEVAMDGPVLDAATLAALRTRFFDQYEAQYGRGSAMPQTRLEVVNLRCRARSATPKPELAATDTSGAPPPMPSGQRSVYWSDQRQRLDSPVFDGEALRPGQQVSGPALVDTRDTTVVLHPGQQLVVDRFGNFELDVGSARTAGQQA